VDGQDGLDLLVKGLEDESFAYWLAHRDETDPQRRHTEAFSEVLYLIPQELRDVGAAAQALIGGFRDREADVVARPPDAAPVALVTRLFPILAAHPPVHRQDGT
jgi:hypothetical protein